MLAEELRVLDARCRPQSKEAVAMRRHRPIILALALAASATLVMAAPPGGAQTGQCTASFHVLDDDHIGRLSLPAGLYQLRTNGVTCANASHLFTQFLEDYNGVLPRPWRYTVQAVGQGTFASTRGGSFEAIRTAEPTAPAQAGSASAGGGSHGELICPGTFDVEHNDRVGRLRIGAGDYTITLPGGNLTCATAERFFGIFLSRPLGKLPRRWVVLPQTAEFMKNSSHHGFRIKPA
jgi:hypothetical protein